MLTNIIRNYLNQLYDSAEIHKENSIRRSLSEISPQHSLLDVGCSDGENTLSWAKFAKATKIYGTEIIRSSILKTKRKGIKVFELDVEKSKWPFITGSLDCVISNLVIEHLSDVDYFISESARVLKRGGYTIVSTNNLSSWHNIFSLLFGWAPIDLTNSSYKVWSLGNPFSIHNLGKPLFGKTYTHKCVYTSHWIKCWYELYGFELVKERGSGYYPLPAWFGSIDKKHSAFITLVFRKK